MARLQILQLPSGAGDERPPFILVIDQVSDAADYVHMTGSPERLGARAVLVFAETVDIPANDTSGYNGVPVGSTEWTETVERALGIDTRAGSPDMAGWLLTACRELEKSEASREALREALSRVRELSGYPQEHMELSADYRHGYTTAISVARNAAYSNEDGDGG